MGVLYSEMREADKAREMYERALTHDAEYVPALFNRAGLFEETGERQPAIALYRRILSINPRHWDSLARLAHAQRITSADAELIESLQHAIGDAKDDSLAREGLFFALGKAQDDLGRYDEAFAAYSAANQLGSLRNPAYDRLAVEQTFDRLIELFDTDWIKGSATESTAAPIFICGMFRSGSTLIEQILAAHPSVTAGGELDFLPWLMARKLAPYPQRIRSASREELQNLANEYLTKLQDLHPDAENITDKRPDNFLHLGLIKALFPSARIVYTKRNPLDNCLSVYFQQLGGNLSYATDLKNIAHYYTQHGRLMAHWLGCLGENIFTVDYDELVRSPEPVLRALLGFLGLEWDDRCLAFQRTQSLVKTASVWQVREELHTSSSGRWRNYEPFVRNIRALLQSGQRRIEP
jgi:tetratricopeptide (TPR) repeat protein